MLNRGQAVKNVPNIPRITWTTEDWNSIARELRRRNPATSFKHLDYQGFRLEDFEDAMETVMPQERQKSFDSFEDLRRDLYNAYQRVMAAERRTPVTMVKRADNSIFVKWIPEEWETVVLEYHRLFPLAFSARLENCRIPYIRQAVEILPFERRRVFHQIPLFREQALRTWDSIPDDQKNPPRNVIDFKTGPIVEPPEKKSDDSSAIATAMHQAFRTPMKPKEERKTKVFWKAHEWLLIAEAMHKQNPHANFFESNFTLIDLPAVREAQRVALPLERRKKLSGTAGLREPLIEGFKALKAKMEREELEPEETKESPEEIQLDLKGDDIEVPEGFHAIPILNARPQEVHEAPISADKRRQAPQSDFTARLAVAATPLINLFVGELAKALAPELAKAFAPMVETVIQGIKTAVTPVIVNQTINHPTAPVQTAIEPEKAVEQALAAVIPTAPKKPKIAVLGPFGKQKEELERFFPEFRFTFIEHGHGIKEAAASCVLFVASNLHINASSKQLIKSHVNRDILRYVEGGLSNIKRQIQIWKDAQKILDKH